MAACNASALTCDVKIASALTKAAKNASVVREMRNIWMEGQGARPEASAGCIQGAPQLKFNSVDVVKYKCKYKYKHWCCCKYNY